MLSEWHAILLIAFIFLVPLNIADGLFVKLNIKTLLASGRCLTKIYRRQNR